MDGFQLPTPQGGSGRFARGRPTGFWSAACQVAPSPVPTFDPATAGESYHTSLGSYSRSGSVNNLNRSQIEIGSMEVKKHELMHQVAGLREELTVLQGELEKDYGTFDINIQDGTINYPKENGEVNKED